MQGQDNRAGANWMRSALFSLAGIMMLLPGCGGINPKTTPAFHPASSVQTGLQQDVPDGSIAPEKIQAAGLLGEAIGYAEEQAAFMAAVDGWKKNPKTVPKEMRPIFQLIQGFRGIKDPNKRMLAIHTHVNSETSYDEALSEQVGQGIAKDAMTVQDILSQKKAICSGYSRAKWYLAKASDVPVEKMGELTLSIRDKKTGETMDHVLLTWEQDGVFYALNNTASRLPKGQKVSAAEKTADLAHCAQALPLAQWLDADPGETRTPRFLLSQEEGRYVVYVGAALTAKLNGIAAPHVPHVPNSRPSVSPGLRPSI